MVKMNKEVKKRAFVLHLLEKEVLIGGSGARIRHSAYILVVLRAAIEELVCMSLQQLKGLIVILQFKVEFYP